MPRYFDPADVEERMLVAEEARRRSRQLIAERATPASRLRDKQLAERMSGLIKTYPDMRPGVVAALAKTGHGPDSPFVKQLAVPAARAKRRKSGFFAPLGKAIKVTASFADDVADTVVDVGKGASRTAMLALSAPYEEVQGAIRNVAATGGRIGEVAAGAVSGAALGAAGGSVIPVVGTVAGALGGAVIGGTATALADPEIEGEPRWESQSQLGVALGRLATGERVDVGHGFIPSGEVAKAQAERARRVQIAGHAVTPGRLLAVSVTEPGTGPYQMVSGLLDASLVLKADPAIKLTKTFSAYRASAPKLAAAPTRIGRLAEAAGLVHTYRPNVLADNARAWLATEGAPVLDRLTEVTSIPAVHRLTGKKLPIAVARALADISDRAEMGRYVEDAIFGGRITEKFGITSPFGIAVRRRLDGVRLLGMMPGSHVSRLDTDRAYETVSRYLLNAKVDREKADAVLEAVARADDGPAFFEAVVGKMTGAVAEKLAASGVSAKQVRRMTRHFGNQWEEFHRFFVDAVGNNVKVPGAVIDDTTGFVQAHPHLWVEYLHNGVPLPDARAIRQATSRVGRMVDAVPGLRPSATLLDSFTTQIFKPFALARLAWPVRVIAEEQLRMSASGVDAAFNHPLSWISWAVSDRGRVGRVLRKTGLVHPERGWTDISGEHFLDQLDNATADAQAAFLGVLSQRFADFRRGGTRPIAGKTIYRRDLDPENWAKGLADELGQLRADPIGRRVAHNTDGLDGVRDWFKTGAGQKFRQQMAAEVPELADDAVADAYIASVADRLGIKTTGDARLLEAVLTGSIDGVPMRVRGKVNQAFVAKLDELGAEGIGPAAVKGDIDLAAVGGRGSAYNRAVDHLFATLMGRPTDYLSRSPTFRQKYWQRVRELVPFMDETTQTTVIKNAAKAGLSERDLNTLASSALRGKGTLALDDADTLAKADALDATKRLLYDATERSQFGDIYRTVFPFADAWREVLTRWTRIVGENPGVIRRGQVVVEGARGSGFFSTDPQTGEEMFTIPATEWLSRQMIGVPVPLKAAVGGLNLFSQNPVIPGFGPAVTLPTGWFLPDKPDYDWMRKVLLPFGEERMPGGPFGGLIGSQLPPWLDKVLRGFAADPESDRMFGNTMAEVMAYLVSTGRYSTRTPDEQERLLSDAKEKARYALIFRGLAQAGSPSAPTFEHLAEVDPTGHLNTAFLLRKEFQRLQDEDHDSAVERFLERFGERSLLYLQAKTQRTEGRGVAPPTEEGSRWERDHPELAKRHPEVFGYFAPQAGEFDYTAFLRQLDSGARQSVNPRDAIRTANHRVAKMRYERARERVGPRPNERQRALLREFRESLRREYPGFDELPMDVGRNDRLIRQVRTALEDRDIADSEAGRAAARYLAARDRAMERAGLDSLSSKKAAGLAEKLSDLGDALAEEHPDFARLWDEVFSREVENR